MARLPRLVVPNHPHHLVQRGNSQQAVFQEAEDYVVFLKYLREAARTYQVAVHAYVLMTNHFHLLVSPADAVGLGKMMQWVGRYYVPYFNRKYGRAGTLWEGRYKATVIDSERYFMTCSRYIELNPVRAGMVGDIAEYPWSSYAHHAGVRSDPLITDHPLYWALGNTPFERELAYREMVQQAIPREDMQLLKDATWKGWALGSDQFKNELERKAQRRVAPVKRGRPVKRK